MTSDELHEWEDLTRHPGFLRLKAWAFQELDHSVQTEHARILENDADANLQAIAAMRLTLRTRTAIERILAHPEQVIRDAKAAAGRQQPSASRGVL